MKQRENHRYDSLYNSSKKEQWGRHSAGKIESKHEKAKNTRFCVSADSLAPRSFATRA